MQEYVLVVSSLKGHPKFEIYKSSTNSIDVLSNSDFAVVAFGTNITYQDTEPNGVNTFTLVVSEP